MSKRSQNYPINHIGLSVPDIEAAKKWYTEVLGFTEVHPIVTEDFDVNPDTIVFNVWPPGVKKLRIAYLSSANGVGLELFEFVDPKIEPGRESSFESGREFKRGGLFHFAVTVPDVDAVCKNAVETGGKMIRAKVRVYGHEGVYLQDPWGNAIEVLSCSFEQLLCNRSGENLVKG